jgi:predicted cupin superfamily sugar epimerase
LFAPPKPIITAKALQKKLGLEDLEGEGGYFRRIYESDAKVGDGNFAATSIYFMLTPD